MSERIIDHSSLNCASDDSSRPEWSRVSGNMKFNGSRPSPVPTDAFRANTSDESARGRPAEIMSRRRSLRLETELQIVKDFNTQPGEKNGHKAEVLKPIRTRRHLAGPGTAAATTSRIRIQPPADPLGQAASSTPAPPGLSFSGFPVADTNEKAPAQQRRGLEWLVAGAGFEPATFGL